MRRGGQTGRRVFRALAAGGSIAALAGCGSSGGLSHAQFVSRADSYCHEATARVAALTAPSSLSSLAGYADQTRAETVQLANRLASLKPSGSDKQALARYVSSLDTGNALLARIATAAAANEATTVGTLGKELAAVPTAAIATDAGLTDCAQSTAAAAAG